MNHLHLTDAAGAQVVRKTPAPINAEAFGNFLHSMGLKGRFVMEHWRNGERIDERQFDNGVTNQGKNFLLNVMFHGTTPDATWYLGLIDNAGYSALAATDTYVNLPSVGSNGFAEATSYTDTANSGSSSTRPTWTPGAASGQSITNSSVVVFDITGTMTVKGIFVVGGANAQTKSDHTSAASNILWSTALFSGGDSSVLNGDQIKITYTVSA